MTYSLLPMVVTQLLGVLLSYFLAWDEDVFLNGLLLIGVIWSVFLLIKALSACHQYTFTKSILSILFSILGIFVVCFIFILFLSVSQQIISFIVTVGKELMLR